MASLKIGFLFPYSGTFPDLKNDFRQGFDLGMSKYAPGLTISALGEFIQMGDRKSVEDALNKLLFFEQVDVVLGIVGKLVTMDCIPLVQKNGIPVIINNLGESIPSPSFSTPSLFYNSLHLWKSQWSMGMWAQAKYGGCPAINLSIYEAGYQMHECFQMGAAHSGAETVTLNILKNINGPIDTTPLIQYLTEQQPPHAHALLSGKESAEFLHLFAESPLRDKVPLSVHPFMTEEPTLDLPSMTTWTKTLDNPANLLFVEGYVKEYEISPTVYSLLGYEDGLALGAALASIEGRLTKDKLRAALSSVRPEGPRGHISLSTQPLLAAQPVYLCKPMVEQGTGLAGHRVLETVGATHWDDPSFASSWASVSGWQNPYLCV